MFVELSGRSAAVMLLATLDEDALTCVITVAGVDEDALCSLSSTCRLLASLARGAEAPWMRAAASHGINQPLPQLSWKETVVGLRWARFALRDFAVHPPASGAAHTLRCSATQQCIASTPATQMAPLISGRDKQWISWFGRFNDGMLHVEPCRIGGRSCTALHLHDTGTGKCAACVIQPDTAGDASGGACCP